MGAQTFLPARPARLVTSEPLRTRIFRPDWKYSAEKAICAQRSQVIVMLRTTMSTPFFVLQDGDPVARLDDDELHLVLVAEDRLGDGVDHVDVEALDLAGERVA